MNYLVTGGAGFIGTHLVRRLIGDGHNVRVLDGLVPPVHTSSRPYQPIEGVEFIRGAVDDIDIWRQALIGVDRVYHLAGYMDYQPYFSRYYLSNTVSSAMLFETIVVEKMSLDKVVFASSQAIYGEGSYECESDGMVYPEGREFDQLDRNDWDVRCPICGGVANPVATTEENAKPHNAYAMSKISMEQLAHNLGRRYDIATVALLYSIVHGPGQSPYNVYSGALQSFCVRVLNGKPPTVFEDGCQFRDYVNVHDVTDANILVMESDLANGHSFNVGGERWTTVTELANLVQEVSGYSGTHESSGMYRVGDVRHIVSDISKLKEIGWRPRKTLREGVVEYLDWLRKENVPDTFAQTAIDMSKLGMLRGGVD